MHRIEMSWPDGPGNDEDGIGRVLRSPGKSGRIVKQARFIRGNQEEIKNGK